MYKQILIPDKKNHSIEMPKQFFGKKVEVTVVEIDNAVSETYAIPPPGKKVAIDELFEHFGISPNFPSIEEIRDKAWPGKW